MNIRATTRTALIVIGVYVQACAVPDAGIANSKVSEEDALESAEPNDGSNGENSGPMSPLSAANPDEDDTTVASTTNFGPLVQYQSSEPVRLVIEQTEDGAKYHLAFRAYDESGNGVSVDVVPYTPGIAEWAVDDGVDGGLSVNVWGSSMDGVATDGELTISFPTTSSIRLELDQVTIGHHGNPDNPGEVTSTSSIPSGVITADAELSCVLLGAEVPTGPGELQTRESPIVDEDWSSEFCQQAREGLRPYLEVVP